MFGAVCGDYLCSAYERLNQTPRSFENTDIERRFTDATVLSIATAEALMDGVQFGPKYREWFQRYPGAGYTRDFVRWIENPEVSGSATLPELRASPIGWGSPGPMAVAQRAVAVSAAVGDPDEVSPLVLGGAIAIAREGYAMERTSADIVDAITDFARVRWPHPLIAIDKLDTPRPVGDRSAPGVFPALLALRDADDFVTVLHRALQLRRAGERVGSVAGALAEVVFGGVPEAVAADVWRVLPPDMQAVVLRFWRGG